MKHNKSKKKLSKLEIEQKMSNFNKKSNIIISIVFILGLGYELYQYQYTDSSMDNFLKEFCDKTTDKVSCWCSNKVLRQVYGKEIYTKHIKNLKSGNYDDTVNFLIQLEMKSSSKQNDLIKNMIEICEEKSKKE